MSTLSNLKPKRVFEIFEEICAVPRGSGDMEAIADYCMAFAEKNSLKSIRDTANNVIIFKNASSGYEQSEPVILQGHLDMVCQKCTDCKTDFLKDGIIPFIDGDFVKAEKTSLGADNGIAVAMILSILESNSVCHPPIKAVFTTDEEIGMVGAFALDFSVLTAHRMINIDSEAENVLTVSCAGGSDFQMQIPITRHHTEGTRLTIILSGLAGGHSGVEIDKGRVNADILLGRILNHLKSCAKLEIISVSGGDKANAIPNRATVELCTKNPDTLINCINEYTELVLKEIRAREPDFKAEIIKGETDIFNVFDADTTSKLISTLVCVPNGITEMSAEIDGLVETSLNLGVLATGDNDVLLHFALRSNKKSALYFLAERLTAFAEMLGIGYKSFGFYPPWEFKNDSPLQEIYKKAYRESFGSDISVEAIHAGLECGVFASKIEGLDCISIGPDLFDVHTVNERLSISSTERVYELLLTVLKKL